MKSTFLVFTCMILMLGCSSHSVQESSITAKEFDNSIELAVPASKVKMTIPKLEFVKQNDNPTNSYRYFYYWDTNAQLGISGWFEPESLFKGTLSHWNEFLAKWKGNPPTNVSFEKLNNWEIVRYNIDVQGCSQSNAKAFLVQDETWLEIHVSSFCKVGAEQADIIDFINNIKIDSKA
jgi:hypothetical protein